MNPEAATGLRPFRAIYAEAAARKGGAAALEATLATTASRPPDEVAAMPDDRILSEMTRRIFHAGISWDLVDRKWPAFEEAFAGFDPATCAFMSDADFDVLMANKGIIRNGAKIRAVQTNARFVLEATRDHGSAARFLADWPDRAYVDLLALLRDRASHLGGHAAGRFLRAIGKPAFITSPDMVAALIREGVVAKPPSGKRDMATVQAAFNTWSEESGRDLTVISRVLSITA